MGVIRGLIGEIAVRGDRRARSLVRQVRTGLRLDQRAARSTKELNVGLPIGDVLRADFASQPYVAPPPTGPKDSLSIAWVIPQPSPGSGGLTTISRFAHHQLRSGHEVRFYIANQGADARRIDSARQVMSQSFGLDVPVSRLSEFASADAVLATYWPTAYAVFNLASDAHKFYFVQDFEPYFYEVGSQYVLAENTYRMGMRGITAGKWLAGKLQDYGMLSDHFEFGADLELYRSRSFVERRRRVCFYARPSTGRRAFELGVLALSLLHSKRPDIEIALFGADISRYRLPFPHISFGQLPPEGLAALYQGSMACLVLSLTNVSLLPLELLAAGCTPVVNSGENNTTVLEGVDAVKYAEASPSELAAALIAVVDQHVNSPGAAGRAAASVGDRGWEQSYVQVEKILLREITGLEVG